MSYRIRYPALKKCQCRARFSVRLPALTVLCFLLFLLLVKFLWPEGNDWIRLSRPVAALDQLASELWTGDSVMTILTDFLSGTLV